MEINRKKNQSNEEIQSELFKKFFGSDFHEWNDEKKEFVALIVGSKCSNPNAVDSALRRDVLVWLERESIKSHLRACVKPSIWRTF